MKTLHLIRWYDAPGLADPEFIAEADVTAAEILAHERQFWNIATHPNSILYIGDYDISYNYNEDKLYATFTDPNLTFEIHEGFNTLASLVDFLFA